jgi:hypothetical protein
MRLTQATQEVVRSSNLDKGVQFGIHDTHKIISWIVDKMYADKISSPIREVACNAYDAHLISGQTKPFRVILPTQMDPQLIIRDYGPGLSREFMETKFTQVGLSTKDQCDKQVGAFGAGRLSPFAYADMFVVTTRHLGWEGVYALARDEQYRITITLLSEGKTDQTGLEVAMPIDAGDFHRFRERAEAMLAYFPDGAVDLIGGEIVKPTYFLEFEDWAIPTVEYRSGGGYNNWPKSRLVMGPVVYDLDWDLVAQTQTAYTENYPHRGVEIRVPLGAVSLQPNREQLSYDERTRTYLESIRQRMFTDIQEHIATHIDGAETLWEATTRLGEMEEELRNHSFHLKRSTWRGQPIYPNQMKLSSNAYVLVRGRKNSASFQGALDFQISKKIRFLWNDKQGQRGYGIADLARWVKNRWSGQVVLVNAKSFDEARAAVSHPPEDLWETVSEVYHPVAKGSQGPRRIYEINRYADVSVSDRAPSVVSENVYIEIDGTSIVDAEDYQLVRLDWARQYYPVWGLSKSYRSSDEMKRFKFKKLRVELVERANKLLADPAALLHMASSQALKVLDTNDYRSITNKTKNTPASVTDPLWRRLCDDYNTLTAATTRLSIEDFQAIRVLKELNLITIPDLPQVPDLAPTLEQLVRERPLAVLLMRGDFRQPLDPDWETFFRCLDIHNTKQ